MPESSASVVLLNAVYDDVGAALADLAASEQLHEAKMIGTYDAAVVDRKDGEPQIVRRVDRPAVRVNAATDELHRRGDPDGGRRDRPGRQPVDDPGGPCRS